MNSKKLFSIFASTLFFITPFSSYAMNNNNIPIEGNSNLNEYEIKTPCCGGKFHCFDLMKRKESSSKTTLCPLCKKPFNSSFLRSLKCQYKNCIDKTYKNYKDIIDIHQLSNMKGKNDKQIIDDLLKKWKNVNVIDVQVKYNEYSACPGEILIVYVPDLGGFGAKLFSDINKTVVIKDKIFGEKVNEAWREFARERYEKSKSKK